MTLTLDILAFGAILSGILVITQKNPVISVLFLISVFINAAGYLVLMGTAYLGLVYLIIYVGAIAILFLFVIMMLNLRLVELIDTGQEYTKNLPLAAILGSLFFLEVLSILPTSYKDTFFMPFSLIQKITSILIGFDSTYTNVNEVNSLNLSYNLYIADTSFTKFLPIESIGQGLYTYATMWLIIASLIFLLAMVGPILLCMNNKE